MHPIFVQLRPPKTGQKCPQHAISRQWSLPGTNGAARGTPRPPSPPPGPPPPAESPHPSQRDRDHHRPLDQS